MHGRSCGDPSTACAPFCSMQQQQQRRVMQLIHTHATSKPSIHSYMWLSSPSGLASGGGSPSSGHFRAMHSQARSPGGSPRQVSDRQCMSAMLSRVPTARGSSLQANAATAPHECCSCSGAADQGGPPPATQLQERDCIDMLDSPVSQHFQFHQVHALSPLLPLGRQHQRDRDPVGQSISPAGIVCHSHARNSCLLEDHRQCESPCVAPARGSEAAGSSHGHAEAFAHVTEPDGSQSSVSARSVCSMQHIRFRSTRHSRGALNQPGRSRSAPPAEKLWGRQ